MTISDSNKILKAIPGAKFVIPVGLLGGLRVAIDISILLYKFSFMAGKSETNKITSTNLDIKKDSFGRVISSIINKLTYSFIENKIMPIIVFDGPAHKFKENVIKERKNTKLKTKEEIKELKKQIKCKVDVDALDETETTELVEKLKKKTSTIIDLTSENIEALKEALTLCGIPHIEAENDAEKLCAILNRKGIVDFVYTNDFDAVVFGASAIVTSIKDSFAEIIIPELIYLGSGLSREQFVDFCILLGCDYNTRVKGFGPVKSLKSIIEFKNIEGVINNPIKDLINKGKLNECDVNLINLEFCRNEFLNPETEIDLETYDFEFRRPEDEYNTDKLIKFYNYISSFNETRQTVIEIIENHIGKKIIEETPEGKISSFVNPKDLSSYIIKERTKKSDEVTDGKDDSEEKPKSKRKKNNSDDDTEGKNKPKPKEPRKKKNDSEEDTEGKDESKPKVARKKKNKIIE